MNKVLARELKDMLINYDAVTNFVDEQSRNNMSDSEKGLFRQLMDDYEILIFNKLRNFINNFVDNSSEERE